MLRIAMLFAVEALQREDCGMVSILG